MVKRVLQAVGLVSVLALPALGVGALVIVKDRIQITVREGDSGDAPDPLALVRDDLQQLHADLDAISKALGGNMAELARVLDEQVETQVRLQSSLADMAAAVSRADTQRVAQSLTDLDQKVSALHQAVLRLESAATPADVADADPPAAPMVATDQAQPAGETPVTQPVEPPVLPTEQPTEQPTVQPARKPAFLSFELPSQGFEFDKPQHYKILASLSRVGFDAKSTLHDFSGVTSKIRGDFYANLAAAEPAWKGEVSCDAAALRTGVDGRDEGLREHLKTDENARITFRIEGFAADAGGIDSAKRTVSGSVSGRMEIRGETRTFAMPVTIAVDQSQRLLIEGQAPLKLTDYGVPVPSQLGLISMEDEVKVWISLRARSVGSWDGSK
jgi:polyisoprenoid-binding protein YceI